MPASPVAMMEPLESRVLLSASGPLPRPDHVVVVVEENHSFAEVLGPSPLQKIPQAHLIPGASDQPAYFNQLARRGASLVNSHGVTYPSQPNYLALFSGSTQGVSGDEMPAEPFNAPNLGRALLDAGLTFAGYSQGLPAIGFTGGEAGAYTRSHNPWVNFSNLPPTTNLPFSQFPRKNFDRLPTVSFVVPDKNHDMHDGSMRAADKWLRKHLRRYERWAQKHNSLLIVTWDESSGGPKNQIPTLFNGPMIRPGRYPQFINHFNVLRTIEEMYDLPNAGSSAEVMPITDIFV